MAHALNPMGRPLFAAQLSPALWELNLIQNRNLMNSSHDDGISLVTPSHRIVILTKVLSIHCIPTVHSLRNSFRPTVFRIGEKLSWKPRLTRSEITCPISRRLNLRSSSEFKQSSSSPHTLVARIFPSLDFDLYSFRMVQPQCILLCDCLFDIPTSVAPRRAESWS